MRLQARVMAETMSRFGSATMRMVLRARLRLLWIASIAATVPVGSRQATASLNHTTAFDETQREQVVNDRPDAGKWSNRFAGVSTQQSQS